MGADLLAVVIGVLTFAALFVFVEGLDRVLPRGEKR